MKQKVWCLHPRVSEDLIEQLLANRNVTNQESFLNPQLTDLKDPFEIQDLEKAVLRIKQAVEKGGNIVVYGDFDVDGITATGILWEALSNLGAKVTPYIPNRFTEGYGLHKEALEKLASEGAKLVISVDCGVTAVEETEFAKKLGLDLIITDHHQEPEVLPEPFCLVHTTSLSGAGIAYKLARALNPDSDSLDLAALGTIADMVPLIEDNRILAAYGLEALRRSERLGLKALMEEAVIKQPFLETYHVSFMLIPRLNAMGRLEHAMDSLRLLLTKKEDRAKELARKLSLVNQERQKMTIDSLEMAKSMLEKSQNQKMNIIYHPSFNSGVIGLIAGRLVDEFGKPSIVMSVDGELAKGSARSVNSFNIIEAIRSCADLLQAHGGHPMAAGFTIETKNISEFENRLYESIKELSEENLYPILNVDAEMDFPKIDLEMLKTIKAFAPFGVGNPEPTFVTYGAEVLGTKLVGEGKHLKLQVRKVTEKGIPVIFEAIGFGLGNREVGSGRIDIAYTLNENVWNGSRKIELKLKDFKANLDYH